MSSLFSTPKIKTIETPSEQETTDEVAEQKKKEREALGAFFGNLSQGGAEELRSPTSGTGLRL
jgi:hypothetical protein